MGSVFIFILELSFFSVFIISPVQKNLDKVNHKRYNNAIEMTGGWK